MTGTAGSAPLRRKAPRWMTVALIASLAVNLLVIGAVLAASWRMRQALHIGPPAGGANLLGFAASLPPERRQQVLRGTGEARRMLRELRREVRTAREAARTALLAETFDADDFEKVQARVLEAELNLRTEAQKLFLGVARTLTREERAAFARWHSAEGPRGGRGWFWQRRHRGEGPPEDRPDRERDAAPPPR